MDAYLNELTAGLPDSGQMARIVVRMLAAALLGAMVGIQRERAGKAAGVRTHMLVSMGGALFVITCLEWGMDSDGMSRVIQGLVTGIGFIGGGAILKLAQQREVEGLTTAAGLWMTCAVGIAAGLGRLGAAALGVVLTVIILGVVGEITHRLEMKKEAKGKAPK
ncbi:MAG TPA: MgtC/SapB family protein [Steroidobacteraceae bacterium]|nr:MgtC/SapB family protein [Steroidobacteraceae bacterium]